MHADNVVVYLEGVTPLQPLPPIALAATSLPAGVKLPGPGRPAELVAPAGYGIYPVGRAGRAVRADRVRRLDEHPARGSLPNVPGWYAGQRPRRRRAREPHVERGGRRCAAAAVVARRCRGHRDLHAQCLRELERGRGLE